MHTIINKHWSVLQINPELQETFKNNPFVAFKRKKKLQEIIGGHTIKNGKVYKAYSKNRKGKCETCNTGIYLMECALCKDQYVAKAETTFNTRLNNHRKNVNNPKYIPADQHFRKPGYSFNLHAKFTLIEQLSNIHRTDKDTLKILLKCCEDFWIQKLETLTLKGH